MCLEKNENKQKEAWGLSYKDFQRKFYATLNF